VPVVPSGSRKAKAKSLLTSHGWTVNAGGVSTCSDPAKCGPGIKAGQGLSFTMLYESGAEWLQSEMTGLEYMYNWEDYLSSQLPVIWQPQSYYQLTEIADNLKGVAPQSTTLSIDPELVLREVSEEQR
jgi:hypothetical protein